MVDFDKYDKIIKECRDLGVGKNLLYGDESLKLFNGTSIFVRMYDKIERLKNLYTKKDLYGDFLEQQKETIEDTLKDLINYSVYLILSERGEL